MGFSREGESIRLQVSDDGIGMAPKRPPSATGTGLGQRLIRSMVAQLGGTHQVGTDHGKPGTTVTVQFPVAA